VWCEQADVVESIAALVESKSLEGVADVRDESDRTGTRVVVEVRCAIIGLLHAKIC
jgi:DNA gyrase subunit A